MSDAHVFDLVVIGAGPAGIAAANTAALLGKKVAVVERCPAIGGAAVNTGTIPSKTLRETALALFNTRARALHGVDLSLRRWSAARTVPSGCPTETMTYGAGGISETTYRNVASIRGHPSGSGRNEGSRWIGWGWSVTRRARTRIPGLAWEAAVSAPTSVSATATTWPS